MPRRTLAKMLVRRVPAVTGLLLLVDALLLARTDVLCSAFSHLALPVPTLVLGTTATIARFTRSGALETLQLDFVTYERAVGYSPRVIEPVVSRSPFALCKIVQRLQDDRRTQLQASRWNARPRGTCACGCEE